MLPEDPLVTRFRQVLRLEVGLIGGSVIILLGLLFAAYAIGFWTIRSFGHLDPQESLRIVVPSATMLILGMQIISSSCLLSILQLEGPATAPAAAQPAGAAPSASLVAH